MSNLPKLINNVINIIVIILIFFSLFTILKIFLIPIIILIIIKLLLPHNILGFNRNNNHSMFGNSGFDNNFYDRHQKHTRQRQEGDGYMSYDEALAVKPWERNKTRRP